MGTERTIAIIGGGIAGLGPAWQLAVRGWEVHLFERETTGSGASTRAAGMLAPTSEVTFDEVDLLELGQRSLSLYPRWVDELVEVTGADLGYRTEGTLIVGVDRDDAEALEHLYQYHRQLGLAVERLTDGDVRQREPGLSPRIRYGLFTPHDHQIDPVAMVEALTEAFVDAGGHLHEHAGVTGVRVDDQRVVGLDVAGNTSVDFSRVVIAAGAWSSNLKGLPDDVMPRIRPVRGQMICVDPGDPPIVEHVIRAPDAYLVPKSNGRLLVGSTMEERGFDDRLTAGGLLDILRGAWEAVPAIYDAPVIDTWTGFRPLTLANRPRIGPTGVEGLYLCVGHGRNGILLTPVTAYGLAELIDTGQAPDYLTPFLPGH